MNREQHALFLGVGDLSVEKLAQRLGAQKRRIQNLTDAQMSLLSEHGDGAVFGDKFDTGVAGLRRGDGRS